VLSTIHYYLNEYEELINKKDTQSLPQESQTTET